MDPNLNALDGRTALVTGAGRGVGRATALELARTGAAVALVARSADELAEAADRVQELGGTAAVLVADLTDLAQLPQVVTWAEEQLGQVDILINNAAVVAPLQPSATLDVGAWTAALHLNVVAPAALTFALLPAMLARGWGRIANVSSGIVDHPTAMIGGNAYVTTKVALEAHTINLAAELGGTGVTVNAFRPGTVDTAMQTWIRDQDPALVGAELHERFTRFHTDGALITPERAAASLVARLHGERTGDVWDVADPV